ncbi:MAG: tyrosine-type recombinase/integrase [Bryobacteraceae bacterium]
MPASIVTRPGKPWCFFYYTGMRLGEVRKLQRAWILWNSTAIENVKTVVVIPEDANKNRKRRVIPVYDEMDIFLKLAWETGDSRCPYIFQNRGKQIKTFRGAFNSALTRANLPGLLFHDLRRTAVRNMERAGIPRTYARYPGIWPNQFTCVTPSVLKKTP